MATEPFSGQPTIEELQQLLAVMEVQRNQAMNQFAVAQAKADQLTKINEKLTKELEELKKKP